MPLWVFLLLTVVGALPAFLLEPDRLARLARCAGVSLSAAEARRLTYPINSLSLIAPFQSAELLKARLLSAAQGLPYFTALGLLIMEKVYLLFATLALLLLALAYQSFAGWGVLAWLLGLVLATPLLFAVLPKRLAARGHLPAFLADALGSFREIPLAFCYSFMALCLFNQLFDAALFALALAASGADVPLGISTVWVMLALLASKLPLTPGGLGLREGGLVWGLAAWAPSASLVAASLLFGVTKFVLPSLLTLGHLGAWRAALKQLRLDTQQVASAWQRRRSGAGSDRP